MLALVFTVGNKTQETSWEMINVAKFHQYT